MRRSGVLWGLALVAVGVTILLQNLGTIPNGVSWWPIALVVVGLAMLVEATRVPWGGFVVPMVLIAIGAWLLLRDAGAVRHDVSVWPAVLIAVGAGILLEAVPRRRRGGPRRTSVEVPLRGAAEARVELQHGAGRLRVGATPDPAVLLRAAAAGDVERRERLRDGRLEVTLRQRWRGGWPSRWGPLDWSVDLTTAVPVALHVRGGAADSSIDLSEVRLTELVVETGASRTEIGLPRTGRCRVWIKAGAANVLVRVPKGVAARITTSVGLAAIDVDPARFPPGPGGYASPDFEAAEDRAEIRLEGGAASFSVR